jgi:hypothetical protein
VSVPATSCFGEFIGHINNLEYTRVKSEKLFSAHYLTRRDIEQIYKGLFLEAFCFFEQFIENLFVGLVVSKYSHSSAKIVPGLVLRSSNIARDIIFGGKKYVDWLPYHWTEQRALAFFLNGIPFSKLKKADKDTLEQLCYIRNAIAHKSQHSKEVFEQKIISSLSLTPRDSNPAPYLRTVFRISPKQTRYEDCIFQMAQIALVLCT